MLIHVPQPHPATLPEEELLKQCSFWQGRGSGPGGQHRNKVETKAYLTHEPTGVEAHAGERRSMVENRSVALRRLRLELATRARAPVPIGEIGSDLWKSRCRGGRISCNPRHWDYPALLAEAMDVLAASIWDPSKAALRLECTPSQLIKMVKDHPPALARLNLERESRGAHALK